MSEPNVTKLAPKIQDLTGQVFERLTVVRFNGLDKTKRAVWECRCRCGTVLTIKAWNLKNGHQRSCGCLQAEMAAIRNATHGYTRGRRYSRVYRAWGAMRNRCTNASGPDYRDYGGRGISVCERWAVFENFLADMGEPPVGMSLDRIDVNGNYEPSNCRWATSHQQSRNTRRNVSLTHNGKTQLLVDWGIETGLGMKRLSARLAAGWSVERALTEKPNPKRVAATKRRAKR